MKKSTAILMAMTCVLKMANALPTPKNKEGALDHTDIHLNLKNINFDHSKINPLLAQKIAENTNIISPEQYLGQRYHKEIMRYQLSNYTRFHDDGTKITNQTCYTDCHSDHHSDCGRGSWFMKQREARQVLLLNATTAEATLIKPEGEIE